MSSKRPLIGISASFFHPDPNRNLFKGKTLLYAEQSLMHWVMSAGAVPVLLPTVGGALYAADMVEQIDGLLLQGGADMSPEELRRGAAAARVERGRHPRRLRD